MEDLQSLPTLHSGLCKLWGRDLGLNEHFFEVMPTSPESRSRSSGGMTGCKAGPDRLSLPFNDPFSRYPRFQRKIFDPAVADIQVDWG